MLRTKTLPLVLLLGLYLMACHRNEGVNQEPIFKQNPPESVVYKNKLGDLIRADDDALSYYIEGYEVKNGHDYIKVSVSGPDVLATGYVQINNPKGIEDIVVKRAKGYYGAELEGLQLDVIDNPKGATLLYNSVEDIKD